MDKHLHIVSFNVPWLADYGGVIDVFYRLKALSEAGVKIHLHCFTYGRPEAPELERYCEEVCYYRRNMSPLKFLDHRPFIVSSRDNKALRRRLSQDSYPILIEGLHCCSLLEYDNLLQNRLVMVRAHNVEADYYARLAASEKNLWRKAYLKIEASRISRYEPILTRASAVLAISQGDKEKLERLRCRNVLLVSASHQYSVTQSPSYSGTPYALYQGDLTVADNYNAAARLINNVFADGRHPLVVAGKEPPEWLKELVAQHTNVTLVPSPDEATMQRLIAGAQVNVLLSSQATGLKLKLLNALFAGGHCLVNSAMVQGSGLDSLCHVADTDEALRQQLDTLMTTPFDEAQIATRQAILQPYLTVNAIKPILEILSCNSL